MTGSFGSPPRLVGFPVLANDPAKLDVRRLVVFDRADGSELDSIRLFAGGEDHFAALGFSEVAAEASRRAGDDQLLEWVERLTAQALATQSEIEAAEKIFHRLAAAAEDQGNIAYDAATAFHLAGYLLQASRWYRRALGSEPRIGRFDYELGLVLALTEMGDVDEARAVVERLKPASQSYLAQASCRGYVHWRRGEPLELAFTGAAPQGTYDLFRYWNLEFRRYLGEATPTLLPDVIIERERASEEYRGLVRALEAELRRPGDGHRTSSPGRPSRFTYVAQRLLSYITVTRMGPLKLDRAPEPPTSSDQGG